MSEEYIVEPVGARAERMLNKVTTEVRSFFSSFSKATAETFAWLSIIVMHAATIPSFLAVKAGLSDKLPSLELVSLIWVGLLLYFIRSAIIKDMLAVITIGVGFAVQALFLGLIFFQ